MRMGRGLLAARGLLRPLGLDLRLLLGLGQRLRTRLPGHGGLLPSCRALRYTLASEAMVEYIESAEFDEWLVRIIRAEGQPDMQESLIERSRVLVRAWAADAHAVAR